MKMSHNNKGELLQNDRAQWLERVEQCNDVKRNKRCKETESDVVIRKQNAGIDWTEDSKEYSAE